MIPDGVEGWDRKAWATNAAKAVVGRTLSADRRPASAASPVHTRIAGSERRTPVSDRPAHPIAKACLAVPMPPAAKGSLACRRHGLLYACRACARQPAYIAPCVHGGLSAYCCWAAFLRPTPPCPSLSATTCAASSTARTPPVRATLPAPRAHNLRPCTARHWRRPCLQPTGLRCRARRLRHPSSCPGGPRDSGFCAAPVPAFHRGTGPESPGPIIHSFVFRRLLT